jgi:hypothetical protein
VNAAGRNWKPTVVYSSWLTPLRQWRRGGRKPARLYTFAAGRFEKLNDKGILFPF